MSKRARQLLIAAGVVALVAAVALSCAYLASRQSPKFYRQALAVSRETLAQDGQQFERTALDLHNQLQHDGRWQTSLTQDEINGWLATDLPAKFPQLLPPGVSQPRVAIEDGVLRIAAHYERDGIDTVLSLSGEAYLTAQPNELAVRLTAAQAGMLPLPLEKFIREITELATSSDLPLRWTQVRGAPVALLRIPMQVEDSERRLVLDRVDLLKGRLLLAGRIQDAESEPSRPATAAQSEEKTTRQR
jgi:hypothetical protein